MTVDLQYSVSFGKLDGTGGLEWSIDLTEEENAAYEEAIKLRKPFDDYPILEAPLERAYEELCTEEFERFKEDGEDVWGDTYTECLGEYPVDEDEITRLVHNKDPHALEFFHLTGMSDEELSKWDACSLDDLPNVCDFDKSFEPKNPFEWYWSIDVNYAKDPETIKLGKAEATETLKDLFEKAKGDYTEVKDYLSRCKSLYTGKDLTRLAADTAIKMGLEEFTLSLPFPYLPSEIITDSMCEEAVAQNPFNIQYVPEEHLTESLCKAAVNSNSSSFTVIPDKFKTSQLCWNAICDTSSFIYTDLFRSIPEHLLTKEICLKYIQSVHSLDLSEKELSIIPEEYKDRDFYLAVASKPYRDFFNMIPLEYVDYSLCKTYISTKGKLENIPEQYKTYELCLDAISRDSHAIKDVPESIIDSKMCWVAVSKNYSSLKEVPRKFVTKELCLEALHESRLAFDDIPYDLLDEDICWEYIRTGNEKFSLYSKIPKEFLNQEMCLEMIKRDPFCFIYIPEQYRNEECCLAAIEHCPWHIEKIPEKLKTKEFYKRAKDVNSEVRIPEEYQD